MKTVVLIQEPGYRLSKLVPLEDNRSIAELLAEFIEKYK